MDTAWSLRHLLGRRTAYFVHTQENGLTGRTSDSFWRIAAGVHRRLERSVVRRASQVVVFNDQYAQTVSRWNRRTQSSPTWYDPDLIGGGDGECRDSCTIIWVGRLEVPKDPLLALDVFEILVQDNPTGAWRLDLVGSGTLDDAVEARVAELAIEVRARVTLHGRTTPARVAELMARAGVFLMSSHAGYEGYPRVLVEALASGLPAVVTEGADTGHLVQDSRNGFVTSRDPQEIAQRVVDASGLPRDAARASVAHLSAPEVISKIYNAKPDNQCVR
ncbi:glycosyltransferase [Mycolicibacterium baixiangningiae]|uniref:glycosyltransferase n=1 Tax=Mycolicibacterium baixiangningiae TaxID=2761578 RepID=UPI003557DC51